MKKIKKLLLIIIGVLFIFINGCEAEVVEKKYDYTIFYENLNNEVLVEEFDLSDILIHKQGVGVNSFIKVTKEMLSEEDYNKTKIEGNHIITINYNDQTFVITINLVNNFEDNPDPGGEQIDDPPQEEFNFIFTSDSVPQNYYETAKGFKGENLKIKLRKIISVQTKTESYDDLRKDLARTDAGDEEGTIRGFYTHKIMDATWDSGVTWNREHVWPKSKGWFKNSGAGADIHHIRPESSKDNNSRGNKPFGEVNNEIFYCPPDDAKGDTARIILYMLVRYEQTDKNYPVTNVAQSMEMLLRWNMLDPVDSYEIKRNNISYEIQGNRNPFIDCPDFANYIWDYCDIMFEYRSINLFELSQRYNKLNYINI